ncbi:hypothetical protein H7H69_10840 [Mycobacterium heckeshornense]|uniref:hypothetical protein n=1 Tax=Mycobacterium heckeshornense TaxID=110505 RepID=UPI00115657ED|nr:hypothetical protein [Mycobacterium heckeshornense]MCV7034697.1 hypothetical protein [Mycobacterium heckeshornense]
MHDGDLYYRRREYGAHGRAEALRRFGSPPPQDQQPMRLNYNIECPVCRDKLCLRAQRLYAALDSITETVETDRLTLTVAALRAACHIVGRPLPS